MRQFVLVTLLTLGTFYAVACAPAPATPGATAAAIASPTLVAPSPTPTTAPVATAAPTLAPRLPAAAIATATAAPTLAPRLPAAAIATATATSTPLPLVGAVTATPAAANRRYVFHVNLIMDESVTCPGAAKCDNAYIPKMTLYLRGGVTIAANRTAAGEGTAYFINVEPCKTLLPDTSSCKLDGTTAGRFTIEGQMEGDSLRMTLRMNPMPGLAVTMTSKHPSGPVPIAVDATYREEIGKVLEAAKIIGAPIVVNPTASPTTAGPVFEGTYTFAKARTLHAFGGLFFISADAPLPQAFTP